MKERLFYLCVTLLTLTAILTSAQNSGHTLETPKAKLVVGIVIDQMRNDYIYRYWNRYGKGGFRRLAGEGFYFRNAHYNYIPTFTGPGHSSIYTGTTPRIHGIIENAWYNKTSGKTTQCVQDTSVSSVGTENKKARVSPKNQLSSTIGDELRMSTNKRSKVFGIAIKDRSAVLPAGHAGNAAFFMDKTGAFVTSGWYLDALPNWMEEFNKTTLSKTSLEKEWKTLYSIETYSNSISDDNPYEEVMNETLKKPVFPYDLKKAIEQNKLSDLFMYTPAGNTLTKNAAIACLINESLGKDENPDLLAISFSSPDVIGHAFGPRSVEVEDVYLRLDKDIEDLLNTLDKEVGKNNYLVFLTADHGGADVPNYLIDNKIPAGYLHDTELRKEIRSYFKKLYGDSSLVANVGSEQVFLNETKLAELKLDKDLVEQQLCNFLVSIRGITEAYPSRVLKNGAFDGNDLKTLLQNGYNHKLSGNVCYVCDPAWMDHGNKGTTHGAGYNYDTHVPILFYGTGIKKGESFNYTTITQIAPTICELLRINQPNSTFAEPLNAHFK